jgi:hypothetical protein
MPDSYNPSRPSDQAGTQATTFPVSESSNAFTAGADTTRDPDLPQTQSPPTTASRTDSTIKGSSCLNSPVARNSTA